MAGKNIKKANKILFIVGLVFILLGQLILAKGNDFVYNQKPIDFAHWFILAGVTLLIPQTVTFPQKLSSLIGIPLTLIGIVCIIGMCVLDFIWWSFPNQEMRDEFTYHISHVPSIWKPFMTIGPSSKIFNLGLLLLSLNYIQTGKIGIVLVLIGNLILWHIIPFPFRLVLAYAITLIGFSIILLKKNNNSRLNPLNVKMLL